MDSSGVHGEQVALIITACRGASAEIIDDIHHLMATGSIPEALVNGLSQEDAAELKEVLAKKDVLIPDVDRSGSSEHSLRKLFLER